MRHLRLALLYLGLCALVGAVPLAGQSWAVNVKLGITR